MTISMIIKQIGQVSLSGKEGWGRQGDDKCFDSSCPKGSWLASSWVHTEALGLESPEVPGGAGLLGGCGGTSRWVSLVENGPH